MLGFSNIFGCNSGSHDWELWKLMKEQIMLRNPNRGPLDAQERTCKKCGKLERRIVDYKEEL